MKKIHLTQEEKQIENALLKGEYQNVNSEEFHEITEALARRRKDAVLNIRMNSKDLTNIKRKAKKLGVKYQTLISEFLHRLAA